MTQGSYPVFADQGGLFIHNFKITGASVSSGQSTAGLDARGQRMATIGDAGGAVQTVVFNEAMINAYVNYTPLTADGAALLALTTNAAGYVTGFTLTGVTRDSNGTPLANQDFFIQVFEYKTTQTTI